jgi:hypothetical protein
MKKRFLSFILLAFVVFSCFFTANEVTVNATAKPAKPKITVKVAKNGTDVKITISKTTGADGFRIYMVAPKQSKYGKIKTITKDGTAKRSYTKKNLADGKYSFKVRAYKKSGNTTVWGKYSKVVSVTITSSSMGSNGESKNYGSLKVSKEYDVSHFKPFKEVTSTFNTVKLSDSFGSGDFSFKSATHIAADDYSGVFSSWLSDNSLFGEQWAFKGDYGATQEEFSELNVIPTISKTNTKGLTTETILGTKEEATEILDAWLEARHADLINNYKNDDSVYYNDYGVNSYSIDGEGHIKFKSYKGTRGIGVNTDKFGEAVYTVGLWVTSNGQMDDVDIANQKLADIEILSLISSDPYDLVMKMFDGDTRTAPIYSHDDSWFRINDMLIYRDSSTGNIYMKPIN